MAKEKKGRKFGRNRGSADASTKMYTAAKRWITNKAKKIKRHEKAQAKHAAKLAFKKDNPKKKWGEANDTVKSQYLQAQG